jgi:hypothetical protein
MEAPEAKKLLRPFYIFARTGVYANHFAFFDEQGSVYHQTGV